MLKFAKLFAILTVCVTSIAASGAGFGDKKIKITAIPGDAAIWVNGQQVANGSAEIKVADMATVQVAVSKTGYITLFRTYVNNKVTNLPKNDLFSLSKDPSYDSSANTDIVNRDIDIRTDRPEEDAWRMISQIVTSSFDVIEVTDRSSGYLRTAWNVKRFDPGNSVRTRLIVKMGNSNPLLYKVKIICEVAPAGTSARDDEKWQEWDRLLRTYVSIIPEIQSRLAK